MKHYSTKELLEVNNKAPILVQETLSSESTITTISNLGTSFKLHIDQIGLLAELNVQMLLGLVSPQEFLNELIAAKIPDKDAREIMTEINQKIFVPLREELRRPAGSESRPQASGMRKGPNAEVKPPQAQSVAPYSAPRESVLQPRTTIIPANPNLPPRPAQTLASVPRYVPPKKYFNLQNKIPPPQNPPAPSPQPPASRLLEDHEEPHIEFHKTAPPPPNLPGAIYHPPIPKPPSSPAPAPQFPPQPVVTPPKLTPPPQVKPYSSDPYREPIDEK